MSETIGIGIIGCGGIAEAKHIPALLQDLRVKILKLYDAVAPDRAQALIEKYHLNGCQVAQSLEDIWMDSDIDAVNVCTPNSSHCAIAIAAMQAGKHVICEKPMAVNSIEAKKMIDTAKLTGKKLTVCANNRFKKEAVLLKFLCEQDVLGSIYYAKAHAIRRRGVPTWGNFLDITKQGGGPVIDIGTHALDLALWLMNNYEPDFIMASTYNHIGRQGSAANPYGNWHTEQYTIEDMGVGLLRMKNGATVLLEASFALNILDEKTAKVTLCGTKAGADMEHGLTINGEENGYLYNKEIVLNPTTIPFYESTQQYGSTLEMKLWMDAILEDKQPVTLPEQMLVVTEVIETFYKSAQLGQPIYF